ncbi:MAG: response regulator [Hydrogenophaga sp.]|nr:response regulator [Hydrogenophaga sp.]
MTAFEPSRPAFGDTSTDLSEARALVIDGNPQSRSTLVAQLRQFGMGNVTQCPRLVDARRKLEIGSFDVVVCEHYFERERISGQDLLDDLRRNQLLPFYTVFIIMSSEASYSMVAEAAESALDAYLIRPFKASALAERIFLARLRKSTLQDIFTAIDAQDFERATQLCQDRFESRGRYWLYAARIGAELLLRAGRIAEAQQLYTAVVEAKTLPWARLGVARTQLDAGYPLRAATTLELLIQADPTYADAYDLMGRAQFEQGHFENALATYQMATKLTPSSVKRLLKHGIMAFYAGDRAAGVELLDRATRIGLESKLFDPQALVLLAFARLENDDGRGLLRCEEQLTRLLGREPESVRLQRLLDVVLTLQLLREHQIARALDGVRRLAKTIREPAFDFEAACNLLALLAQLANRSIQLYEVDAAVDSMGLRFCTSRALTELLAFAAAERPDFADRIRTAHGQVLKLSEQAMVLSLRGDPRGTVLSLLEHAHTTLNGKLIESAHQVLQRYGERIEGHAELDHEVQALRVRYRSNEVHVGLGEQVNSGVSATGLALPAGYRPPCTQGLLARVRTD